MKNIINGFAFGRNAGVTLLIAFGIVLTAAFACESGGDKVPPDAELQSLMKDTMSDFANAVDTGDFEKLHSKASTDFQSGYTTQQMKSAFQQIIDQKDLALPSLKNAASLNATFSPAPSIRSEKGLNILVTSGEFPSKPYPVKFDNEYVWRDGGWKLLKLKINL